MANSRRQNGNLRRFGVIGYGAVGAEIVRCLEARGELSDLVGVLDLPDRLPEFGRHLGVNSAPDNIAGPEANEPPVRSRLPLLRRAVGQDGLRFRRGPPSPLYRT